jgi:hypothetical protein
LNRVLRLCLRREIRKLILILGRSLKIFISRKLIRIILIGDLIWIIIVIIIRGGRSGKIILWGKMRLLLILMLKISVKILRRLLRITIIYISIRVLLVIRKISISLRRRIRIIKIIIGVNIILILIKFMILI